MSAVNISLNRARATPHTRRHAPDFSGQVQINLSWADKPFRPSLSGALRD